MAETDVGLCLPVLYCVLFMCVRNGIAGQEQAYGLNFCQEKFGFLWIFYTSNCYSLAQYPTPALNKLDEVSGNDVISRLSELCMKKSAIKNCIMDTVAECEVEVQNDVAAATNGSAGVCEDNGDVITDIKQIFLSEMSTATHEDRNRERCHGDIDTDDCWFESLNKFGLYDYDIFVMTTAEVFSNDVFLNFYRYLFKCTLSKVAINCPSNSMTMAVALRSDMLFPPRFGIDMAVVLLDAYKSKSF